MRRNPLKRALRVDKMTLAALEAVLQLYPRSRARCDAELPTLRLLTREQAEIEAAAQCLQPCAAAVGDAAQVTIPNARARSAAARCPSISCRAAGSCSNRRRRRHRSGPGAAFRTLPVPVIGRVHEGAFLMDLRCLEDESVLTSQLASLRVSRQSP